MVALAWYSYSTCRFKFATVQVFNDHIYRRRYDEKTLGYFSFATVDSLPKQTHRLNTMQTHKVNTGATKKPAKRKVSNNRTSYAASAPEIGKDVTTPSNTWLKSSNETCGSNVKNVAETEEQAERMIADDNMTLLSSGPILSIGHSSFAGTTDARTFLPQLEMKQPHKKPKYGALNPTLEDSSIAADIFAGTTQSTTVIMGDDQEAASSFGATGSRLTRPLAHARSFSFIPEVAQDQTSLVLTAHTQINCHSSGAYRLTQEVDNLLNYSQSIYAAKTPQILPVPILPGAKKFSKETQFQQRIVSALLGSKRVQQAKDFFPWQTFQFQQEPYAVTLLEPPHQRRNFLLPTTATPSSSVLAPSCPTMLPSQRNPMKNGNGEQDNDGGISHGTKKGGVPQHANRSCPKQVYENHDVLPMIESAAGARGSIVLPCGARGMPLDHNFQVR